MVRDKAKKPTHTSSIERNVGKKELPAKYFKGPKHVVTDNNVTGNGQCFVRSLKQYYVNFIYDLNQLIPYIIDI